MSTKTLRRAVQIDTNEGAQHLSFSVSYFLTSSELIAADERLSVMIYGIELVKTEQNAEGELVKESTRVDDISLCANRVKRMIDLLADHSVTPVHLKDVVQDLLVLDTCCGDCGDKSGTMCGDKIA